MFKDLNLLTPDEGWRAEVNKIKKKSYNLSSHNEATEVIDEICNFLKKVDQDEEIPLKQRKFLSVWGIYKMMHIKYETEQRDLTLKLINGDLTTDTYEEESIYHRERMNKTQLLEQFYLKALFAA